MLVFFRQSHGRGVFKHTSSEVVHTASVGPAQIEKCKHVVDYDGWHDWYYQFDDYNYYYYD